MLTIFGKEKIDMIQGIGIIKEFDALKALSDMNIHIKKGSVYGLVGPNGAGKTTFIKALMSIYNIDGGTIKINDDQNIKDEALKQKIVYISDDLYFFPSYSVKQMADFYASVYENWDKETFDKLQDVNDSAIVELPPFEKTGRIYARYIGKARYNGIGRAC